MGRERGGEGGGGAASGRHSRPTSRQRPTGLSTPPPEKAVAVAVCDHLIVMCFCTKWTVPYIRYQCSRDQCSSEFCLGKRVNLICCTNSFLLCLCSTQKKSAAPLSAQPGVCKLWEKKSGFRIISDFFAHFSVLVLLTWVGVFCGGKDCDDPHKGAKSCKSQRKKLNLPKIYILRRDSGVLF